MFILFFGNSLFPRLSLPSISPSRAKCVAQTSAIGIETKLRLGDQRRDLSQIYTDECDLFAEVKRMSLVSSGYWKTWVERCLEA